MNALSSAPVTQVRIDSIEIGQRRREKLGRLQGLKKSIADHGLIHPILLRGDMLVAGRRRLEACRQLEWKTIPARQVVRLSDDEVRAVELEENTTREDLTDHETSKARLAVIRQAEADLKARAKADEGSSPSGRKTSKGGRPPKAASREKIADETGISDAEQRRTEQHVTIAERYPFMQRGGWVRHHVLDAGALLDKLPEADRSPIAALLDQEGIPPAIALEMLAHGVDMAPVLRARVIELASSEDAFERRTAGTMLKDVPPPPDPGLLALHDASDALARAAKSCRSSAFRPRVVNLSSEASALLKEFHDHEQEARHVAV